MREVPVTEAKIRLSRLLRAVEHGETIAITRHGRTIAHLAPAHTQDRGLREEAVDRFLQRRSAWRGSRMSTDEVLAARHEGHRI